MTPIVPQAHKTPETDLVPVETVDFGKTASRHALALLHTGVVTWTWDLETDNVECDDQFYELFDLPFGSQVTGKTVLESLHPEDLPVVSEALEATFNGSAPIYDCRFRIPLRDGHWRWLRAKGQVMERSDTGAVLKVVGINYDYTEQVAWEERLSAIANEMRHRVKNSLAMVNALATATARETDDMAAFLAQFRGRVDAIAAAQRIVADMSDTHSMTVRAAVMGGLSPFLATSDWGKRIKMDTVDEATIPTSIAQAITLCVYEFATNAIKYGALGTDDGVIRIISDTSDDALPIGIIWDEQIADGASPDFDDPGFGSTLIKRLVRGERGELQREIVDGRLMITMRFPERR